VTDRRHAWIRKGRNGGSSAAAALLRRSSRCLYAPTSPCLYPISLLDLVLYLSTKLALAASSLDVELFVDVAAAVGCVLMYLLV
jgi:hypothetical protein